jgi:hypothetical protein
VTEKPTQRSRAQLRQMSPEEIFEADRRGEFDDLLAGNDPGDAAAPLPDRPSQLGRDDLKTMTPQEISEAERRGQLDDLLAGRAPQVTSAPAAAAGADPEAALRSAVVAAAARRNVVDPDAAFALVDRAGIEIAADGTASGVEAAIDRLLETRPYLRDPSAARQLTRADLELLSPEQIREARQAGRLDALLRGER